MRACYARLIRMNPAHNLIFDATAFQVEIVFVGKRCARDNLLRDYRTGSLHFVRSGRAEVLVPGQPTIRIEQPSLVFFADACPHQVQAVDDAGFDLVCAFTSFGDIFRRAVSLSFPQVMVLPLHELTPIRHALEAFFAEAASEHPGSRQLANRLCEVVLTYVARHALEAGGFKAGLLAAATDTGIAAAVRAIHTRFQSALGVDVLAREAGMSRSRFVERFRSLVGTSPHDYLVAYRITQAQEMLVHRLPVKTVAERVGFATASAFVRRFKEIVGVSPAAWAK
jgi:AraC-like DNA-binding protein